MHVYFCEQLDIYNKAQPSSRPKMNVSPMTLSNPEARLTSGGFYDSSIVCHTRGAAGVDNACMCPGTRDTMPYQQQSRLLDRALDEPNGSKNISYPGMVGTYLVDQRKPTYLNYQK